MSLQGEEQSAPAANEHEIDQVLLGLADGSYVLSAPDGSVAECGVGVVALLGSPADRLVGRPTIDVLLCGADADARAAFERLPQADRSEPGGKQTFRTTSASGAELPLEFVVVAVPLALGWEFTSLLSELGSRDTGTWEPAALRLRHGRALEAIESVCTNGAQPDPGGRLAGILIVVRNAEAKPLTREDVGRRMADHRAAQRAAAADSAMRADAELGRSKLGAGTRSPEGAASPAPQSQSTAIDELAESARVLRERLEDAERQA
ncbi:MAG: hypothetical protein M3401_05900, partial [Actinomycetota bacterium]|nr:hypothetical protein [Actinomycetota bacterium]